MNTRSIPLMAWVIVGLLAISALPFVTTVFQIRQNQDSLVKQVQQTHLVSVTATAEKLSNHIAQLNNLLASVGASPSIVGGGDANSAEEVLANALLVDENILAIGVFGNREPRNLQQIAQKKSAASFAMAIFDHATTDPQQTVTLNNRDYLILRQQLDVGAPELLMLVDRTFIQDWLKVPALDDAYLGLRDQSDQIFDGQINDYRQFPKSLTALLDARHVGSAADNFKDESDTRQVAAFARVEGTDWVVISQQPAAKAEIARKEMWSTAVKTLLSVSLLCFILALAAHAKIVRPIRELVKAQKTLLGADPSKVSGSEIVQLKQAFYSLEKHIRDRQKLKAIRLGRYQISDVIASGAMGTVFKGWDPRLEREIAIKTIRVGQQEDNIERNVLIEKLVSEAKLVAKITHPNIVTVFDAIDTEEMAFIAMELVEGISLKEYLRRHKVLDPMQTVALASSIFRGLHEAHLNGIIHRDIKPGNVLLGYNKNIKLSDFGIAGIRGSAMNEERAVVGSPGYIAPEVIARGAYSEASDIFAVGILLYRCLVGHSPFRGASVAETFSATNTQAATPPMDINHDVPEPLSNAVMSLLIKNPARRPSNALLVIESIERAMGVQKWQPFFANTSTTTDQSEPTLRGTMILPDTLVKKHLRTADE